MFAYMSLKAYTRTLVLLLKLWHATHPMCHKTFLSILNTTPPKRKRRVVISSWLCLKICCDCTDALTLTPPFFTTQSLILLIWLFSSVLTNNQNKTPHHTCMVMYVRLCVVVFTCCMRHKKALKYSSKSVRYFYHFLWLPAISLLGYLIVATLDKRFWRSPATTSVISAAVIFDVLICPMKIFAHVHIEMCNWIRMS